MKRPTGIAPPPSEAPAPQQVAPPRRTASRRPAEPATDTEPIPVVGAPASRRQAMPAPVPEQEEHEVLSRAEVWRRRRSATRERRRVERGEVRRFTRRQRLRRRMWLLGAVVVLVVLGSIVGLAFSPAMALRRIEVIGTDRIPSSSVEHALAGQLGRPLPLVSLEAVAKELAGFRLIRSYSTEVEPPSTLIVRIEERTPVAAVKAGAGYELVDQAGVVISTSGVQPKGYPLVTLPASEPDPRSSADYGAIGTTLTELPKRILARTVSVTATSVDGVTLVLKDGKTIIWGSAAQGELKGEVLRALLKGAKAASVYDVSSPHSPVTG